MDAASSSRPMMPHQVPTRDFSFSENVWPSVLHTWRVIDSLPLTFLLLLFAVLFALHKWGTRSAALVILPSHHNTPIMVDKDRLSPSIATRPSPYTYLYASSPSETDKVDFESSLSNADFSAARAPHGTWVPRRGSRGKGMLGQWKGRLGCVREEDGSSSDEV